MLVPVVWRIIPSVPGLLAVSFKRPRMVKLAELVAFVSDVFPRVERPVTLRMAEFVVLALVVVALRVVRLAAFARRRVPSKVRAVDELRASVAVVNRIVPVPPNDERPVPPLATERSVPDQSALLMVLAVASEPRPSEVRAVDELVSSMRARPKAVSPVTVAAPDPVKYGTVSTAEVTLARAVSSASVAMKPREEVEVHTRPVAVLVSIWLLVPGLPETRSAPVIFTSPATERRLPGVEVPIPKFPFWRSVRSCMLDDDATINGVTPVAPRTANVAAGEDDPKPTVPFANTVKRSLVVAIEKRLETPVAVVEAMVRREFGVAEPIPMSPACVIVIRVS